MSDHQHKDRLEEFFQKSLGDMNAPASADGWDTPSDRVWEGIAQNIPSNSPPPAPNSQRKWWLASILILLLLLAFQYCSYQKEIAQFASQVEKNDRDLKELKEKVTG